MGMGQMTVKDVLTRQLGEERAASVLREVDDAYREGNNGEALREHLTDSLKRQGLDASEIKFVIDPVIPSF